MRFLAGTWMGSFRVSIPALFLFLLSSPLLAQPPQARDGHLVAQPRLVRDIFPGPDNGLFHFEYLISPPEVMTSFVAVVGDSVFFSADDGVHGAELWRTDGTEEGTRLVRDILPGPEGSFRFGSFMSWFVFGDLLLFEAYDEEHGVELWRSDGTAEGTMLLQDIYFGPRSSQPENFAVAEDLVFFAATSRLSGEALWRTDGTPEGTWRVKDIHPDGGRHSIGGMAFVDGTLYFSGWDGVTGVELWKSDGTAAGTVMVKDIDPGFSGSGPTVFDLDWSGPILMRAGQGGLGQPGSGSELWRTDGTEDGTVMVKDIMVGDQSSSPGNFFVVDDQVFFAAASEPSDFSSRLLTTDGTSGGTQRVMLPASIEDRGIGLFAATDSRLFFSANRSLWTYTPRSGVSLELFSLIDQPIGPHRMVGEWMIWSTETSGQRVIQATNGLPDRTIELARASSQVWSFQPQLLALLGDQIFFDAYDPATGRELWVVENPVTPEVFSDGFEGADLRAWDLVSLPVP